MPLVRVPATSANLGPGFDALGLALDLWNEVEVASASEGAGSPPVEVTVEGEGAGELPAGPANLVARAFAAALARLGAAEPRARVVLRCRNAIPLARGLGSSAAAAVAGILAAEAVAGRGLARDERLDLAASIEGHPDNVAAALEGGLVACGPASGLVSRTGTGGPPRFVARPLPYAGPARVAVVVPELRVSTARARAALPDAYTRADAVRAVQRTALLLAALAAGDRESLVHAMEDVLHQPYRLPLYPGVEPLLREPPAAYGAAFVCVSGAGPSILAFPRRDDEALAVADALAARWRSSGMACTGRALAISRTGATTQT